MESKIIGSGIAAAGIITIHSFVTGEPLARKLIGDLVAVFLLSAMAAAGLANIAGNLAMLLAGTIVVIYAPDILQVVQTL
jgi:hypothetical protein